MFFPNINLTRRPPSNMVHTFRGCPLLQWPNSPPSNQTSPSHCWHPPILWSGSRFHLSCRTQLYHHSSSNGTKAIAKVCDQLLNYVVTYPNTSTCHKACDMILMVHTDVSYLSKPSGKSHASAHLYLTNHYDKMEPFSPCHLSSSMLCPWHQKPNLLSSIVAAN